MGRLYIFMGKSASGKDTLYRKIMETHKELTPVITYTTRPIRAGEIEGKEYHFVSEEQLEKMKEQKKVVECRCYHTVKGPWYYFTADDGQIDFSAGDSCMITTLEGYEQIRDYYGKENVVPLYIEVDDFVRMERSLLRERNQKQPCIAEVCRRFLADEQDFSEENLRRLGIEDRIQNLSLENALSQIEESLKNGRKIDEKVIF